ncbi:MAG TPA: DUF6766 family protein [Terriglobales bacterium]|nr:DUF6766 family protein [Terriglobales bacterium]
MRVIPMSGRASGGGKKRPGTKSGLKPRSRLRKFLYENGLSIVMLGLFFITFWIGQTYSGFLVHNDEQQQHGRAPVSVVDYLRSAHFVEATTENWESEFLQMFFYVVLTIFLYQKGSSESKRPDTFELVDVDPRTISEVERASAPAPVRKGGWVLKLYENSLGIAFLVLFLASFSLHAISGAKLHSAEELEHGRQAVTTLQYLKTSQFWFESFQNWQSEFLAVGSMVVLSIWLRQKGSPESKPVHAPHEETGD